MKITAYQRSLTDGRGVDMDELVREGIISPGDASFMSAHAVTYKPHRVSDYHALDMLHMPTEDGGCVFIGPGGPPLTKRHGRAGEFEAVVRSFLRIPRPQDELLLHIEFSEHDGMGVAPEMLCFNLKGARWRERLPMLRSVAAELGYHSLQDEELQGSHALTFRIPSDPDRTAAAVAALLLRGCGFSQGAELVYSAGALDEG